MLAVSVSPTKGCSLLRETAVTRRLETTSSVV